MAIDIGEHRLRLHETQERILRATSQRPIPEHLFENVKRINALLADVDHSIRLEKADQYIGSVFEALGVDQRAAMAELRREARSLQIASTINDVISFAPTVTAQFVEPGLKNAGALLGWSATMQIIQPWLGTMLFNAAYYGFDFSRQAAVPGRSRQLESAQSLQQTLQTLVDSTTQLEAALSAAALPLDANDSDPGRLDTTTTLSNLTAARDAVKGALEQRAKREAHDDSFDLGRLGQTCFAATRQLLLYLSQYLSFAMNKDCQGGRYGFYMQAGSMVATRAINVLLNAPQDRAEEGRLITAANIAYGKIATKDDVREMIRAPYVQKMWLINDGVENRIRETRIALAKELGLSLKDVTRLDEAGAFKRALFSAPRTEASQERMSAFMAATDGAPLAEGVGALQELKQLAVLEPYGKLAVLDDLCELRLLLALDAADRHRHEGGGAGGAPGPYVPGVDDVVRDLRWIDPDEPIPRGEAIALTERPLPDQLRQRMMELQSRLTVDGMERNAGLATGTFSGPALARWLTEVPDKGGTLHPADLSQAREQARAQVAETTRADLAEALGGQAPASPSVLQGGPLPADLAMTLRRLQEKYVTRSSLQAGEVVRMERDEILALTEHALADDTALSALEARVFDRLAGKAKTSSLGHEGWSEPVNQGSPDERENLQQRRENSLTPLEHALHQALSVRAKPDAAQHASVDPALARITNPSPKALNLLAELRGHELDKSALRWDFTMLSPATAQSVANVFQGEKGWLGNTTDAITTRWNMPGYIVPAIVVAMARSTFLVVGGSSFFFLAQSAAGLARQTQRDTFTCKPGEGPNQASKNFSYAMMGVSTALVGMALVGAWAGPQAVNTARVRKEYFTAPTGRPSLLQMIGKYYPYAMGKLVIDYTNQRARLGPAAKQQANDAMRRAEDRIQRMTDVLNDAKRTATSATASTSIRPQ